MSPPRPQRQWSGSLGGFGGAAGAGGEKGWAPMPNPLGWGDGVSSVPAPKPDAGTPRSVSHVYVMPMYTFMPVYIHACIQAPPGMFHMYIYCTSIHTCTCIHT